jgi:hypothetical protein
MPSEPKDERTLPGLDWIYTVVEGEEIVEK